MHKRDSRGIEQPDQEQAEQAADNRQRSPEERQPEPRACRQLEATVQRQALQTAKGRKAAGPGKQDEEQANLPDSEWMIDNQRALHSS